jgi:hypothetical protein
MLTLNSLALVRMSKIRTILADIDSDLTDFDMPLKDMNQKIPVIERLKERLRDKINEGRPATLREYQRAGYDHIQKGNAIGDAKDFLDSKFPNSWASNQSLFLLDANANVNAFVYAKDVVLDINVGGMNEQCIINYTTILAFAERILKEKQGKEYYIFQWLDEDSIKFLGCYVLCREKSLYENKIFFDDLYKDTLEIPKK